MQPVCISSNFCGQVTNWHSVKLGNIGYDIKLIFRRRFESLSRQKNLIRTNSWQKNLIRTNSDN